MGFWSPYSGEWDRRNYMELDDVQGVQKSPKITAPYRLLSEDFQSVQ